ncbi:hypothetical protein BP6252_05248 [Coleophoma cylindrospora]|uniref:Uncharacterized protein n=1 Tax=Coleophoma cylindrospora TaxID=1849047 RepID=A0A3D8RT72_9HELO|nr:hypothetical protein BP6252_05248 [Coleophoma cylindrospora]
MPAQETSQPQTQQMELPTMNAGSAITTEQPRVTEQMTAEPVSMRGGGGFCCGMYVSLSLERNIFVRHSRVVPCTTTRFAQLYRAYANTLVGAPVLPASSASSAAVKWCTNRRSRAPEKEED